MICDLHCHTKLSDGSMGIDDIIVLAEKCGVTNLAVTDLDCLAGTDGARLSFEGLPCPNLSTGGINFHSIYEAIPVYALSKMVEVLKNIVSVS